MHNFEINTNTHDSLGRERVPDPVFLCAEQLIKGEAFAAAAAAALSDRYKAFANVRRISTTTHTHTHTRPFNDRKRFFRGQEPRSSLD